MAIEFQNDIQGYNGNPLLKKTNQPFEWTQELLEEYFKCKEDPIYFIENYMKIININSGLVNFILYDYQKEMITAYKENRFNIITTSRQAGKCNYINTLIRVKFLDSDIFNLKIGTIHKISSIFNKYETLYYGKPHELLRQQIYSNLFLYNKEEAEQFNRLWGSASYNSKITWWKQQERQYSPIESQRTFSMPQAIAENERSLGEKKNEEKFIESFRINGVFAETDTGFEPIIESHKTIVFDEWVLKTENKTIICADTHIVYNENFEYVFVKDLKIGDLIQTSNGLERVIELYKNGNSSHMYDLGINHPNHRYYGDGILSKNSTTTCGYILWYVLFNSEKTVALLANKGETAREILSKIQLAYQHLPKWLQHGAVTWNKGSMELENNSRVIAASTSTDNIRGYAINLVFIDEAAHIDNWDEFFTSVYPTISSGTDSKIILVSTPNGLNHFYAFWQGAIEGKNQYKPIRVTWSQVPGRDEKWKADVLGSLNFDLQKFAQEYETEFQGSSGTLISGAALKALAARAPLAVNEGLTQYYKQEPKHSYAIIADVSRGKGLDYSAFQLIDVTKMPYQQACVYRSNSITPNDYAEVIHKVAKGYNNAAVLVEINDIGEQVSTTLHHEYGYENILFTENAGRSGKKITTGFGGAAVDKGIRTTKVVKSIGCSILKLLIEQQQLIINDFDTIEELSTFSKRGTSYEAEPNRHDDLVMGLVLFAWLSDQQYFKEYTDINTLMKLRDKTDEDIENDLVPFGFMLDGRNDFDEEEHDEFSNSVDSWMFRNQILNF